MGERGKRSAIYGGVVERRNGTAAPVEILDAIAANDRGGYAPERLDRVIETLILNAESGADLLNDYTPMLKQLMERLKVEIETLLTSTKPSEVPSTDGEAKPPAIGEGIVIALRLAGQVSVILDRVNKMMLNSVRAKDDATRLRSFLATGDSDGSGGLDNLSERDLRRIVVEAASGWQKAEGNE